MNFHIPPVAYQYAIFVAIIFGLMLMLPFTRGIAQWLLKAVWTIIRWLYAVVMSFLHKFGLVIWQAHIVLFRNLLPRNAVIPTVATKSTRRQ